MTTIREGWTLGIIAPDGTVVDTVALGGYDLDRPAAGIALGYDVRDSLPGAAYVTYGPAELAADVAAGRACGAHDRPLPCAECA